MDNISLEEFKKMEEYKQFQKDYPKTGTLKVQVFTAQQAIPISGVKITVLCDVTGKIIELYSGYTDESGIIDNIVLPAPEYDEKIGEAPKCRDYKVIAEYANVVKEYKLLIYGGIKTLQLINLFPSKISESPSKTTNPQSGL